MASYLPCGARGRTPFFTPFIWAAALVRGNTGDIATPEGACPAIPVPVALELARLAALCALFIGLLAIVAAVFQSRMDRMRVSFASSVTAVVGVDEDAQTLVAAIAGTLDPG